MAETTQPPLSGGTSPHAAGGRPLRFRPVARAALALFHRLAAGRLELTLPDGTTRTIEGTASGPSAALVLHRWRALGRLMRGGEVAFAEAYVDGDWDSPDLPALFRLVLANREEAGELAGGPLRRLADGLVHWLRDNTRRGSRRNIAAHYDLGNDFYAAWLDPGMTYSSARFDAPDQTLERAQQAKLHGILRRTGVQPGGHLLEIGCGWGELALTAARDFGARVTAITVSEPQQRFAAERIRRAGLDHLVDVRLQDYRDLQGRFDAMVSVEMIEAVGERHWPRYFATLARHLRPGGRAVLQAILIDDARFDEYRRRPDFIQRHVFPGGMLPSLGAVHAQAARAGLVVEGVERFGRDYARTLEIWRHRFQAAWPALRGGKGFDESFRRFWTYYLAYCEAGFRDGLCDVAWVDLAPVFD